MSRAWLTTIKGRAARWRLSAQNVALLPLIAAEVDATPPGPVCAYVGGQAVIEGVMMRSPQRWTVTVRRADGSLESTVTPYRGWSKRFPFLGKPILRGAVVLLESMIVGLKALNYSAEVAAGDEEGAKVEPKGDQISAQAVSEAADETSQEMTALPEKSKPALGFWTITLTMVSAFALAMGLFVALPHVVSVLAGQWWGFNESSAWFHLLDGVVKFALFISYVWGIGLIPDIGRVYAYHGAEHKAIFTYEAGEELTPDNAAKHPAWHPRCGTAFIFLVLALSILFFAVVFPLFFPKAAEASFLRTVLGIGLKIFLMLPLAGLAYEVTRQAGKAQPHSFWRVLLWPGLLMQRLTTRTPDKSQLEVALNALEKAVA